MQTIPVNVRHLKAVSLFAAKQDIRYYLNGVMVEVTAKAVRCIATDGHTLGLTHTPHDDSGQHEPLQCIIPLDVVKAAIKSASKSEFLILTVPDEGPHSIGTEFCKQYFAPIDGKYPDYRRVVPKELSGEPAAFDPDLVVRFKRAGEVYRRSNSSCLTTIEPNGDGAGLAHGVDENFIGVIMPWRDTDKSKGLPAWFVESEAPT